MTLSNPSASVRNLSRRDRASASAYASAGYVRTSYKIEAPSVSFFDTLTFGKALFIGLSLLAVSLFLFL
jgi:hypothetical protein